MTAVETSVTNGLANGVHYTDANEPEIAIFKEYLVRLLPYNQAWRKDVSISKNTAISNNELTTEITKPCSDGVDVDSLLSTCPLEISFSETCGRYIKATRDIALGEALLVEPAVVLASRPKSEIHCSNCFKITSDIKCPDCGFFFCGSNCLSEKHTEECQILKHLGIADNDDDKTVDRELIFKRLSEMPPEKRADARLMLLKAKKAQIEQKHREILQQYGIIAPLRTLLKINKCSFTKTLVQAMQANMDINSERYKMNQKLIVDVITNRLKATNDSDLVHNICSVWDTNAFQVVMPQNDRVQGLYPFAGLFNHNCKPNAQQWFTTRGEIVLRAINHIAKGEEIALSYTDPQWSTIVRQNHLQKCKQFTCRCKRCYDPTENGTFLGSLMCPGCGSPMISSAPFDTEAPWVCTSPECKNDIPAIQDDENKILSLGTKIGEIAKKVNPRDVTSVLTLSKIFQKQIHPNHFSLQQLYVPVINILADTDLSELSDDEIANYSEITAQVVKVIRILQAPLSRTAALMGREDLRLQLENLKRKKRAGEGIHDRLLTLSTHLKECIQVLDWDPETMPSSEPLKNLYEELINIPCDLGQLNLELDIC